MHQIWPVEGSIFEDDEAQQRVAVDKDIMQFVLHASLSVHQ